MQTQLSRARTEGFTLIELLVVVLIIGILAAIALPNFVGQRTKAKNAAATSALRNAFMAARSYYTESESFTGLSTSALNARESTISATAASVLTPGSTANPTAMVLYDATTLASNGGAPSGSVTDRGASSVTAAVMILCSVSKGDAVYCIADNGTYTSYGKMTSTTLSTTSVTGTMTWAAAW